MSDQPADDLIEETEYPYLDVIEVEMFQVQVPVFVDPHVMLNTLRESNCDVDLKDADAPCHGMAYLTNGENGGPVMALYLEPESDASVWVHEASHLVDMIFETRGISPCFSGTETRAYMLQYIFQEICRIMVAFQEGLDAEDPDATIH